MSTEWVSSEASLGLQMAAFPLYPPGAFPLFLCPNILFLQGHQSNWMRFHINDFILTYYYLFVAVYCSVTQLCLTLFNPMDCSLPGSFVHGTLQARIVEWVAMSFSLGSPQPSGWTQAFCIAGRPITIWATREANYLFKDFISNYGHIEVLQVETST